MQRSLRAIFGTATLFTMAACSGDSAVPTSAGDDADLIALASADPSLSAAPSQASLPGLTMEPLTTYQGSLGPTDQCSYSPTVQRTVCAPVTKNGLTVARSFAFYDAAGKPQTRRDSTTRSVNTEVMVTGSTTRDKGTATVDRASSITVAGLGRGATTHTINGTEKGSTTSSLTIDGASVTAVETFTAATKDVIVPAETRNAWPLSGTTSRATKVVVTRKGATRTSTSSETTTYNGTGVASVTVVRDGVTRNCTVDLASHKRSCP